MATGTEHETLAQLDQALADMHAVAVEAALVAAQADEATYLADPMTVCGFNPGSTVLAALIAVNEAAPKPFDADAWAVTIGATRRAISQVMATADELADVGASGQVGQLTSAN